MSGLVERLRDWTDDLDCANVPIVNEAADALEAKDAEIERLRRKIIELIFTQSELQAVEDAARKYVDVNSKQDPDWDDVMTAWGDLMTALNTVEEDDG